MAKATIKRLNAVNLAALGDLRLADLLLEVAEGSAAIKRRLRLELAVEAGAEALAGEIDKRLATLAASRARVSWRKRGELVADLDLQRRMIVDRLAPLDAEAALDSLLALLDLAPSVMLRVKDPKGEVAAGFDAAAAELGARLVASTRFAPVLAERLSASIAAGGVGRWATWLSRLDPPLSPELSLALLDRQVESRPGNGAARAHLLRVLAEASGDVDVFLATIPDAAKGEPGTGARIAERFLKAGRTDDALAALAASDPRVRRPRLPFTVGAPAASSEALDAWDRARVAALDRLGRTDEAQAARWSWFERGLSPEPLRDHLRRLKDFDDVVATERAFEVALAHRDVTAALGFLVDWPALAEAGALVRTRGEAVDPAAPELRTWIARLEGRQPGAALRLLRTAIEQAVATRDASSLDDDVAEAERLTALIDDEALPAHDDFLRRLTRLKPRR